MRSLLTTNYHLGGLYTYFGWDVMCKLSLCCLRSVRVITHARCCRQRKEEVNPAVFSFQSQKKYILICFG
jgi:hypothetical protein